MLAYIVQRIIRVIPQLLLISILAFIIIQLPPGDIVTRQIERLQASGVTVSEAQAQALIRQYGMDRPMYQRYLLWVSNIITKFDFGYSYTFEKPVAQVIMERMGYTFAIALFAHIFTWTVAIPIGIYVAVKQYSIADYIVTLITFVGLAVPAFFLAMIIMYVALTKFGIRTGGLFSQEYMVLPWSWGKFVDLLKHMWLPVILLGTGGVAAQSVHDQEEMQRHDLEATVRRVRNAVAGEEGGRARLLDNRRVEGAIRRHPAASRKESAE